MDIDTQTLYPASDNLRAADDKTRVGQLARTGNFTIEQSEIETKWSSIFSSSKELTADEMRRVEFLQNVLIETLTMAQGDPSEDQKKRIREVEDELEKLTGNKTRIRLSNVTDRLPGKDKDDKDSDEEERRQQARGIDPNDAVHNNVDIRDQKLSPGMQMLRNNALATNVSAMAAPFTMGITTN